MKSSVMGSCTLAGIAAPSILAVQNVSSDGQRSSSEREHRAFGQKLPRHSPASRTQGKTDCNLAAPGGRSRQEQVGDIAARNEPDQPGCPQRERRDSAHLFKSALVSRLQFRDDVDLGRRQFVGLRQSRGNRRELGRRLPRR